MYKDVKDGRERHREVITEDNMKKIIFHQVRNIFEYIILNKILNNQNPCLFCAPMKMFMECKHLFSQILNHLEKHTPL